MKILQGGAPKCGNFWLYQIIEKIIGRNGIETISFIEQQPIYELAKNWNLNYPSQASIDMIDITDIQTSYRISSIFRMPVEDMRKYLSLTNHVWTHSPICKASADVFNHFDKKVYIIRDPRDRAISAAKYYCSDYMLKYFPQEEKDPKRFMEKNFDKLMHQWVWHVFDHLRLKNELDIHICFFENFLYDFEEELEDLLQYLGLQLDEEQKETLATEVSFKTLKKRNPKHLKKGKAGYWMEQLTPAQKEKAEVIAGPLIKHLNYPMKENREMTRPKATAADFEALKEEIISSQNVLY